MYISVCLLALLCLLFDSALATLNDCSGENTFKGGATDQPGLMKVIDQKKSYSYTDDKGRKYTFSVCKDLGGKAGVLSGNNKMVHGRLGKVYFAGSDNPFPSMSVTYANGDICNNNTSNATIVINCNPKDSGEYVYMIGRPDDMCCVHFALWTPLMCVEERGWFSKLIGTLFTLVLIGIPVYCIGGLLYKRFAMGAQGYEQIPHYIFWLNLLKTVQRLISVSSGGRFGDGGMPTARGGGGATPLATDDNADEYMYQRPALTVPVNASGDDDVLLGSNGGRSAVVRSQPRNMAASGRRGNDVGDDETDDERLLPV